MKNGEQYEGIVKSVSPKMDVELQISLKHGPGNGNLPQEVKYLISSEISSINVLHVDENAAAKDNFTVGAISKSRTVDKDLRPWEAEEWGDDVGLCNQTGGWDANEMFRINNERFGVHSTYYTSLPMYTTPLVQNTSQEYKQRRKMATKMAKEIRNSHRYQARITLKDSVKNEEEQYGAVIREVETNEGSEKSPPSEFLTSGASPQDCSDMKFQRSMSKPADPDAWSQGSSVCEIDPKPVKRISSFDGQLGNILKGDVEKKKKGEEYLLKKQQEIKQQQQEILQQKEEMEKKKQEFERQIQLELKKMEEVRQQKEEERRKAEEEEELNKIEEAQKQEELRREQEEEMKRMHEEMRMECMAKEQEVENLLHKTEELKSRNEDDSANTKEVFVKNYRRNPDRHNDSPWDTPRVVKVGVLARIGAIVLGAITKCIRR